MPKTAQPGATRVKMQACCAAARVQGAIQEQLTGQSLGHGAATQLAGDGDDLAERDRATVLDVLDFLAVTRGLLERAQHERRSTRAHVDGCIAVLTSKPASDRETLPVLGGLLDIITNLLGGHTERSDFGGERGTTWRRLSGARWGAKAHGGRRWGED